MAKKSSRRKPATVFQRLVSLERVVRAGFRQTDARVKITGLELRDLRKEIKTNFTEVEDRIDRLATHVDGFMKLHETLDIEMRVMKEQMNRFEERLNRLEVGRVS